MWAELAVLLSRWIPLRYLYDFENYIFEIRTLQASKRYITCLPPFNFNLYVFIIWGALGVVFSHERAAACIFEKLEIMTFFIYYMCTGYLDIFLPSKYLG